MPNRMPSITDEVVRTAAALTKADLSPVVVTDDGAPWVKLPNETPFMNDDDVREHVDAINRNVEDLWSEAEEGQRFGDERGATLVRHACMELVYRAAFEASEMYRHARDEQWSKLVAQHAAHVVREPQSSPPSPDKIEIREHRGPLTINLGAKRKKLERDASGKAIALVEED